MRRPQGPAVIPLPDSAAAAGGAVPGRPIVGADPPPPGLGEPPAGADRSPLMEYGDLGICNNRLFLRHYIAESPVTAAM